jgi:hypothetical protein
MAPLIGAFEIVCGTMVVVGLLTSVVWACLPPDAQNPCATISSDLGLSRSQEFPDGLPIHAGQLLKTPRRIACLNAMLRKIASESVHEPRHARDPFIFPVNATFDHGNQGVVIRNDFRSP